MKEVCRDWRVLLEDVDDADPVLKAGGSLLKGSDETRWGCLEEPRLVTVRVGQGFWFKDDVNFLLSREPAFAKKPSRPLGVDASAFCISKTAVAGAKACFGDSEAGKGLYHWPYPPLCRAEASASNSKGRKGP